VFVSLSSLTFSESDEMAFFTFLLGFLMASCIGELSKSFVSNSMKWSSFDFALIACLVVVSLFSFFFLIATLYVACGLAVLLMRKQLVALKFKHGKMKKNLREKSMLLATLQAKTGVSATAPVPAAAVARPTPAQAGMPFVLHS
jgi:hypothetical protein